ncbi:hypothetical protein RCL1_004983 [Eukaryota sp. TZLM3-RCL]
MFNSPDPSTIASIYTVKKRPLFQRIDFLPFLLAYFIVFPFIFFRGIRLVFFISLPSVVFLHLLVLLFEQWSLRVRASITYKRCKLSEASHAVVLAQPHCGSSSLCPISFSSNYSFDYHKTTFIFNNDVISKLSFPEDLPISSYLHHSGLSSSEADHSLSLYGHNEFSVPLPSFFSLFKEHATAPFFVFQVLCVLLWCLDDHWYYSFFTLLMLVVFEVQMVHNRLRQLRELSTLIEEPRPMFVYRDQKWVKIQSNLIVPMDLVSLGGSVRNVPADCLLLTGNIVVDESLLTGESAPQYKEPLDGFESINSDENLVENIHKVSFVYAGTEISVCRPTPPSIPTGSTQGVPKSPDGGCLAIVLRTGFASHQGNLLKAMLYQTEKVTVNNKESGVFLSILMLFATVATGFVFLRGYKELIQSKLELISTTDWESTDNPSEMIESLFNRRLFQLILNCLLTLTSVVPPELPMELSLAVSSSLQALAKMGVFCTEPFRIPMAGKLDVCFFDKTGTITEDSHVVQGVCKCSSKDDYDLVPAESSEFWSRLVMSTAHSLTFSNQSASSLIGDALEKSALKASGFSLSHTNDISTSIHSLQLKILKRFPFNSALKRMSVVCRQFHPGKDANAKLLFVAKGAPDMMKSKFYKIPDNYDRCSQHFELSGGRVLALGYKETELRVEELANVDRTDAESDLVFAGFLVFKCPVREGSEAVISELVSSQHRPVMLTGDSLFTAIHVAEQVKMIRHQSKLRMTLFRSKFRRLLSCTCGNKFDFSRPLVLINQNSDWFWTGLDDSYGKVVADASTLPCVYCYDLCIDGAGFDYLFAQNSKILGQILPFISVFGRVSPFHKGLITKMMIKKGLIVSMIGDGSNDGQALRKAHVGIALVEGNERIERLKRVYNRRRDHSTAQKPEKNNQKVVKSQVKNTFSLKDFGIDDSSPQVKPGDVSLAASFSSSLRGIEGIHHVVLMGRSSLSSMLQVYKILGVSSLSTAYMLSILFVMGASFSDNQLLITGIFTAICFFVVSKAHPSTGSVLSHCRPETSVFRLYGLVSVSLQCAVHYFVLKICLQIFELSDQSKMIDFEADFEPSLFSSLVFLFSLWISCVTFFVNYQGAPYSLPLTQNKPLIYTIIGTLMFTIFLILSPEMSLHSWLQVVVIPKFEMKFLFVLLLIGDLIGSFVVEFGCRLLFTERKVKF